MQFGYVTGDSQENRYYWPTSGIASLDPRKHVSIVPVLKIEDQPSLFSSVVYWYIVRPHSPC